MREYFTKHRIWYLATFVVLFGLGFLIFAPHFSFVEDGENLSYSVTFFYEQIKLPSLYTTAMVIYFFASIPFLIGGFLKALKRWPVVFALVISSLFTLFNALLMTLVLISGRQTTSTFLPTIWFYVYVVLQLGIIANLIALIVKLKPKEVIKKRKKW